MSKALAEHIGSRLLIVLGKGGSDRGCSWVPVIGGVLAAWFYKACWPVAT